MARLVDSDSNTKSDKHQQPAAWSEDRPSSSDGDDEQDRGGTTAFKSIARLQHQQHQIRGEKKLHCYLLYNGIILASSAEQSTSPQPQRRGVIPALRLEKQTYLVYRQK